MSLLTTKPPTPVKKEQRVRSHPVGVQHPERAAFASHAFFRNGTKVAYRLPLVDALIHLKFQRYCDHRNHFTMVQTSLSKICGKIWKVKIKRPFFAILGATTKEKSEQGKLNLIHKSLAAKTSWCENTETTEKLLQLDYCGLWVASLASNPTLTDDPDIPPGCCPKDWLAVHNALERRCPWKND